MEQMEIHRNGRFEAKVLGDPGRCAEVLTAWLESEGWDERLWHQFTIKAPGMFTRAVKVA